MNIRVVKLVASMIVAVLLAVPTALPVAAVSPGFATSEVYKYPEIQKKILAAQQSNSDVKGWLIVPGTNINEAVVYSSKDNNHYVNRDWKGKAYTALAELDYSDYPALATYADFRVKWGKTWSGSSQNTVLYGHNYTNLRAPLDIGADNDHIMFGQLPSYTDIHFAKEHPYIYYSTGENEGIWAVFSVAYSERGVSYKYSHKKLIAEWKDRSLFDFDVEVDSSDRLLTLSTCTRQYVVGGDIYYEHQRFVVVARLLRDGESEQNPIRVTVNENPKEPQFPASAYVSSQSLLDS